MSDPTGGKPPGDEDEAAARRAILARRARFVAAALAGISVACGKSSARPEACLKVAPTATETSPQPCLSPPPVDVPPVWQPPLDDAGAPRDGDASASQPSHRDGGAVPSKNGPRPRVCLRMQGP